MNEKNIIDNIANLRIQDGSSITFDSIKKMVSELAVTRLIPIEFKNDEITSGLLGSNIEHCLVIYHPQHESNYFYYTVRLSYQGTYAFVRIDIAGYSVNHQNQYAKQDAKTIAGDIFKGRRSAAENVGQVAGHAIGSLLRMGKNLIVNSQSGSKSTIEEENQWYTMMEDLFNELFA